MSATGITAPSRRRSRLLGFGLCCLLSLACPEATPARQPQNPGPAVEFELAPEQLSSFDSLRFVVGYFAAEGSPDSPQHAYEVAASGVTRAGQRTVRLPLQGWQAPAGQQFVVRIRTVTRAGRSDWSPPSGHVAADVLARLPVPQARRAVAPPAASRAPKAEARRRKFPEQLRANSDLRAALERRFSGVDLLEAASGYPNLQRFVAALVAASNTGIPFEKLKALTTSGRNNSLERALHTLRPDLDARGEARKAQREAKELTRVGRGSARGPQNSGADRKKRPR